MKSKNKEGDKISAPISNAEISKVLRPLGSQSRPGQRTGTRPGRLGDGTRREGDADSPRAPVPGHCEPPSLPSSQGSRAPGQDLEQQGAPLTPARPTTSPGLSRAHSLPGTHWPGLCSPGVGPAARRPVQMRPGCGSVEGSAGGISRPWARRPRSQQSFAGSAPCMARPPGQPRPQPGPARPRRSSPARLLQPKPAARGHSTASRAFPAAEEPQRPRHRAAPTRPTPAGPARPARARASGGAPRGTLGVVVRAAQPRPPRRPRGGKESRGLGLGPEPAIPWLSHVVGSTPARSVGGESGEREQRWAELQKG